MGIGQSTTRRRVQPSLPYQSPYHRLSSSDSINECFLKTQLTEQSQVTIEANSEKTAVLEKEIQDIKSHLSRVESKLQHCSTPQVQVSAEGERAANTLLELERAANTLLELEISEVKRKVEKLENMPPTFSDYSSKKQQELENRVLELTSVVAEMKSLYFPAEKAVAVQPESSKPEDEIASLLKDIAACFIILIFLISILIGVNI